MKKSLPTSSDKQYSLDESAENSSNEYMNLSKEFQMNMINENKKMKKTSNSQNNKNKENNTQNDSSSDEFWDKEFDPALDSFLKSISKESNMEIEALNEVIQELKKMKNSSGQPNNQNKSNASNDESFDSNVFIDKFNECFHVSTSSVDEVLDMIEMIQTKKRNRQNANSESASFNYFSPIQNNHYNNRNKYENQDFSSSKDQNHQSFSQPSNQPTPEIKNKSNEIDFDSPIEINDDINEIPETRQKVIFQNFSNNDHNEEPKSKRNYLPSQFPNQNNHFNREINQNTKNNFIKGSYQNPTNNTHTNRNQIINQNLDQDTYQNLSSYTDNSYNNNNDDSNLTYSSRNGANYNSNSNSSEIDFLKERINQLELENKRYQSQIRQQEGKIDSLIKSNQKLQLSKKRMHQAFDGIEKLVKEQVQNTDELMNQRDSLFSLLQKQNVAFQEIEKRYDDLQQQIIIERLSNGQGKNKQVNDKPVNSNQNLNKNLNTYLSESQSDKDQQLLFLLKLCKQFNDNLPDEVSNEIAQIRDNENMPVQSRINSVISCVCKHLKIALQENESMKNEVMKISNEFSSVESSKSKVINFLENELLFLQKITESSELQNIVFYKPELGHSLQLDPDSRNALLQRCLNAHKFIDKNIGFYSSEQNEKMTHPFNNIINPSSIFALNHPEEFESKMKSLLQLIEEKSKDINDNDFSLFYDILFSQSIMNEILQKHVSYLQTQLQFSIRQNHISEQQLNNLNVVSKNYKDAQNLLASMQQKEKKIAEMILNYFPDFSSISEQSTQKKKAENSISSSEAENSTNQKIVKDEELVDNLYLVVKALVDRYHKQADELSTYNKNVENKLKEAKKIFISRLEKSNKKIKLLKHHLAILKEEIIRNEANQKNNVNLNQNIQNVNSKLISQKNQEIDQIQFIQLQISDLKRTKIELRKAIITLRDQIRLQLDQFRESTQNALGISLNYKKLNEKNQKTIAQFVKEKEALKQKINQANQGFEAASNRFENMIHQLKSHINSLENELNQSKSHNSNLLNANRAVQAQNNTLHSQIDSLNVSIKSLEIKLKSAFDNFNNEKRELNIQFEARMNSLQSDLDSKIKEEQSKNLEFIRCLYKMASKYLNTEDFQKKDNDPDGFISPETIINSLAALIDEMKLKQDQYFSVLSDLNKVHSILNIDPNSLVSSKVEQVLAELIDTQRILGDTKSELSDAQKKLLFLSNENNSIGKFSSQIKQWERWARRVCSIASSAICTTYSTAQLQNSLEEFILSSLEQRPLMYRIQTLREEKKYFLKFPKSILTETITYSQLSSKARIPSFRAVIIVYLGVRRIQKAAGLLPMGYDQASMKKILENEAKNNS